jgi:hypothetical protein
LTAIIKERRWKKDGRKQGQEEKRKKETEESSKREVILFLLSKCGTKRDPPYYVRFDLL